MFTICGFQIHAARCGQPCDIDHSGYYSDVTLSSQVSFIRTWRKLYVCARPSLNLPTHFVITLSRQRSPHLLVIHQPATASNISNKTQTTIFLDVRQQGTGLNSTENDYDDITHLLPSAGLPIVLILGCMLPNDSETCFS